jgi:hypothetical protein
VRRVAPPLLQTSKQRQRRQPSRRFPLAVSRAAGRGPPPPRLRKWRARAWLLPPRSPGQHVAVRVGATAERLWGPVHLDTPLIEARAAGAVAGGAGAGVKGGVRAPRSCGGGAAGARKDIHACAPGAPLLSSTRMPFASPSHDELHGHSRLAQRPRHSLQCHRRWDRRCMAIPLRVRHQQHPCQPQLGFEPKRHTEPWKVTVPQLSSPARSIKEGGHLRAATGATRRASGFYPQLLPKLSELPTSGAMMAVWLRWCGVCSPGFEEVAAQHEIRL